MGNRRVRAKKIIGSIMDDDGTESGDDVPGTRQLMALASPRRESVLRACLEHERVLLHELNAELDRAAAGKRQRRLARLRNGVERDLARLRVLLQLGTAGESSSRGWLGRKWSGLR